MSVKRLNATIIYVFSANGAPSLEAWDDAQARDDRRAFGAKHIRGHRLPLQLGVEREAFSALMSTRLSMHRDSGNAIRLGSSVGRAED